MEVWKGGGPRLRGDMAVVPHSCVCLPFLPAYTISQPLREPEKVLERITTCTPHPPPPPALTPFTHICSTTWKMSKTASSLSPLNPPHPPHTQLLREPEKVLDRVIRFLGQDPALKRPGPPQKQGQVREGCTRSAHSTQEVGGCLTAIRQQGTKGKDKLLLTALTLAHCPPAPSSPLTPSGFTGSRQPTGGGPDRYSHQEGPWRHCERNLSRQDS